MCRTLVALALALTAWVARPPRATQAQDPCILPVTVTRHMDGQLFPCHDDDALSGSGTPGRSQTVYIGPDGWVHSVIDSNRQGLWRAIIVVVPQDGHYCVAGDASIRSC